MTREEAITYLNVIWNRYKAEYEIERETLDAYHMAIEALTYKNLSKPNKTCEVDLISRADAIWAVRKCVIKDVGDWAMFVDKAEAILVLNALPSAEAYFTDVNKIAEWIPVSERLPEDGIAVLTTTENGEVYIDQVITDPYKQRYFQSNTAYDNFQVIAWMPLPMPYRDEEIK